MQKNISSFFFKGNHHLKAFLAQGFELEQPLKRLCDDPTSTVVIISGSQRCILEKNFEDYNVWLAVEHGVFIRTADKNGSQNLTNNIHTDWIASVKFSSISLRELHGLTVSSTRRQLFGVISVQVYLLNHLRTGPISNASVDIVQGERSVEIRVNGVSKGVGIHDILGQVIRDIDMKLLIDYVLCVGHFFPKAMAVGC
ncbi:putative alpha,alpha-trehalose-phosphate synthase (UDP-forming) [Helianthus annuus]|nr:putative alpha,alpha-trehalose-phosphate synthase (UDP-forming) [Helianthus annuus]